MPYTWIHMDIKMAYEIHQQLQMLINKYNKNPQSSHILEEMDRILHEYLKINPNDMEMWLKRALVLYTVPLADNLKAIECLEHILHYEPTNILALVALAYIQDHTTIIDDHVLHMLSSITSLNHEEQSMLEHAQAWCFYHKNNKMYEQLLLKSISSCATHVWNHIHLGTFYLYHNNEHIGKLFIKKGLFNVIRIVDESYLSDPTSISEFIDDYIKGTLCSTIQFSYLFDLI